MLKWANKKCENFNIQCCIKKKTKQRKTPYILMIYNLQFLRFSVTDQNW